MRQRVLDGDALDLAGEAFGDCHPIVGHVDDLHQHVQLDVASHRCIVDDERLGVEAVGFHVGDMAVPVGERLAEPGEADDVGVSGGVGEQRRSAPADQQWQMRLHRRPDRCAAQGELVVVPIDRLAIEQAPARSR